MPIDNVFINQLPRSRYFFKNSYKPFAECFVVYSLTKRGSFNWCNEGAILLIEVYVFVADVCAYKKPCQNGGECSSSGDSYTCSCVEGFQGKNCETGK